MNESDILGAIKRQVLKHHINVGGVSYDAWFKLIVERTPALLAGDTEAFETGVQEVLQELGCSHTVFYHESANRFLPQHTINASLRQFEQSGEARWIFLDVYDGGPACIAGIHPGDALLAVDNVACQPSAMPRFLLGQAYKLTVSSPDGSNCRDVLVTLPTRKGTKERPPILEPKSTGAFAYFPQYWAPQDRVFFGFARVEVYPRSGCCNEGSQGPWEPIA